MIYTHLTRMSFDFYDRVQSGQLISRANSDIRSVQMYLTFGPNIIVQCSIAVVAFIYMLTINVPLAFVAMCTLPFVFFMGLRMRHSLFPVSWLIQSRLAEVATIVDENINGVRVVKSFVAEPRELHALERAADKLQWSYIQDADVRARFTPIVQNLPQVGHGAGPAARRLPRDPRQARRRRDPRVQRLHRDAPGALPDARHAGHARPARGRLGGPHL